VAVAGLGVGPSPVLPRGWSLRSGPAKGEPERREGDAQTVPLVEISSTHFAQFRFYPVNLFGEEATNFKTFTSHNGRLMRELRGQAYQDIHADRGQLVGWIGRNRK
jgi:hypothetical protein